MVTRMVGAGATEGNATGADNGEIDEAMDAGATGANDGAAIGADGIAVAETGAP